MTNPLPILHPVKQVVIDGQTITIRELRWPEALGFLEQLASQVGQFVSPEGRLALSAEKLPELVRQSGALIEYLISRASGQDTAWVRQLTAGQALEVLDAALELNLPPTLFEQGKNLAGRLQVIFGKKPAGVPSMNNLPSDAIS